MYRFTNNELHKLLYNFSNLFDYEFNYVIFTVPEGKGLNIIYYNSPCRSSFDVKLSFDENTELEDIADIIIDAYNERRWK